ncbi:MAG: DUF3450 family protein [Planctomycetota bacterium]
MKPFQFRSSAAGRRLPVALGVVGASTALGLIALSAAPAQDDDRVDGARATIEEYVQTRNLISSERRDWAIEQELLASRIELLELEIESIREDIASTNESITAADENREELVAQKERLAATLVTVEDVIDQFEAGVRGILPRLPEPAADQVQLAAAQIPAQGEAADLSIGIRIQNTIGVLDQLNKFDRNIHVGSALVTAANGREINAQTIHIGLGRAYYANSETGETLFAGVGPKEFDDDEPVWTWQPWNDAHAQITEVIKVNESEAPPAFVRLPILDPVKTIGQ